MKVTKAILAAIMAATLAVPSFAFAAPNNAPNTGWHNNGGKWCYYESGSAKTGWQKIEGCWYYMDGAGVMQTGWKNVDGTWYYLNSSGAMATGWANIDGTWYYLTPSGAMHTGWLSTDGAWYFLHGSGAMATGWVNVGGPWYYMASSGIMQANAWIDNAYWVGPDGAMATNAWVDNGRYWVNANGQYVANTSTGSGTNYNAVDTSKATYAPGGNVYHIYNCRSAQNIKNPITSSVTEAQAKGLTLCKNCENMSH